MQLLRLHYWMSDFQKYTVIQDMYGVFTVHKANSKLQDMEFSSFFPAPGGGVIKCEKCIQIKRSVKFLPEKWSRRPLSRWTGKSAWSPLGSSWQASPGPCLLRRTSPRPVEKINMSLKYSCTTRERLWGRKEFWSENIKINSRLFCRGKKTKFDTIFITCEISFRLVQK